MIEMILLLLLWIYNEPFNVFTYSLALVRKISSSYQNKTREASFQLTVLIKRSWRAWKLGKLKKMRKAVVSFVTLFRAKGIFFFRVDLFPCGSDRDLTVLCFASLSMHWLKQVVSLMNFTAPVRRQWGDPRPRRAQTDRKQSRCQFNAYAVAAGVTVVQGRPCFCVHAVWSLCESDKSESWGPSAAWRGDVSAHGSPPASARTRAGGSCPAGLSAASSGEQPVSPGSWRL